VILSALIFGFLHIWNPNATLFSSVSIALTAGVILAMLYVITRRLWVPIGLHIGWNLTLGGVYGAPVSGGEPGGIVVSDFTGPDWLTGGAFGPEASIITLCVFSLFGAYLIRKSIIDKSWVPPMWRRKK
jgi:membrane protease YdiL (CAAX protease family)